MKIIVKTKNGYRIATLYFYFIPIAWAKVKRGNYTRSLTLTMSKWIIKYKIQSKNIIHKS